MTDNQLEESENINSDVVETQQNDKQQNFDAIREKTGILERQNAFLQQKIMELEQQVTHKPAAKELDYDDEDAVSYGDFKRELKGLRDENGRMFNKLREMETKGRYGDYEQTIQEYLPDVLREEPELAEAIQNNPQMHKLAYRLAQSNAKYHEAKLAKVNQSQVDRIVENNTRPTPSTGRKSVMVQDEDAKLSSLTDNQIMEMFNMAKAR